MDQLDSRPCHGFRTKAYYINEGQGLDPSECAMTAACWCLHTTTVLGPDDLLCSPETCQPGRTCFKAAAVRSA
jgi:hypothetical protein